MARPYREPNISSNLRTLAWCLTSPPLIQKPESGEGTVDWFKEDIEVLSDAETSEFDLLFEHLAAPHLAPMKTSEMPNVFYDVDSLEGYMNKAPSKRLGHLFEYYWHYYWGYAVGQRQQEAVFNLQIHNNRITTGELDAVFYSGPEKPIRHYELAIKFYLGYSSPSGGENYWIGPNVRDRLDLKLRQMCEKQLTLLERATPELPPHWKSVGFTKHLLVKGWLFHPLGKTMPLPDYVSEAHNQGDWLKPSQLPLLSKFDDSDAWLILEKEEWLGWVLYDDTDTVKKNRAMDTKTLLCECLRKFSEYKRAVMFVSLRQSSHTAEVYWEEKRRYILVEEDWPAKIP